MECPCGRGFCDKLVHAEEGEKAEVCVCINSMEGRCVYVEELESAGLVR